MIKIDLDDNTTIYKDKLNFNSKFRRDVFINKLKIIDSLVPASFKPSEQSPGRQSVLSEVYTPEFNFIRESILNLISQQFNVNDDYIIKTWVYYSESDNIYSKYHSHATLHPYSVNQFDNMKTDYTFTYYLQMPDNLKNDEGKLFFKTRI